MNIARLRTFIEKVRPQATYVWAVIGGIASIGAVFGGLFAFWDSLERGTKAFHKSKVDAHERPRVTAKLLSIGLTPLKDGASNTQGFADDIRTAVVTNLSRAAGMAVITLPSTEYAKSSSVSYVLQGEIQRETPFVRVNLRLYAFGDHSPLWADRFTIDAKDDFEAQEITAARIANIVIFQLVRLANEKLDSKPLASLSAEELTIRGKAALHKLRSRKTLDEAQDFFERALKKDPDDLSALVGIAMSIGYEAAGFPGKDIPAKAALGLKYGERAVALDSTSADAHLGKSQAYFGLNDFISGGVESEIAVSINPALALAYGNIASVEFRLGHFKKSILAGKRGLQINASGSQIGLSTLHIGNSYVGLGQYEEGIRWLLQNRSSNPNYWRVHIALASAYNLAGQKPLGEASLQEALKLYPALTTKSYIDFLHSDAPAFQDFLQRTKQSLLDLGLRPE